MNESLVSQAGSKAWYLLVTAVVLVVDQFTKYWAAAALESGGAIVVIRGFMNFNYTENTGIAFGMLNEGRIKWPLVAVSLIAIIVVFFYMIKASQTSRLLLLALSLLAGGISGNLIDRVRMGSVIDFIEVYYGKYHWPVFNIADTAISIGAALLAIDLFLAPKPASPEPVEGFAKDPGKK